MFLQKIKMGALITMKLLSWTKSPHQEPNKIFKGKNLAKLSPVKGKIWSMLYQTFLLQNMFRSCHETNSIQKSLKSFVKVVFIYISRNGWFDFSLNSSVKFHFRPHINIILLSRNVFVFIVIPFTVVVLSFSYSNRNKSRIMPIKKNLLRERNRERTQK